MLCNAVNEYWRLRITILRPSALIPKDPQQKHQRDNDGKRADKRGSPTHIAKRSPLRLILVVQIGRVFLARYGTGGTWPAIIAAGDIPTPVARWAASLISDHRRSPTNRTRQVLRLSDEP
jgi:hypothetical protein